MTRPLPAPGGGRSATCRRCQWTAGPVPISLCSCLIYCGHEMCTGEPKAEIEPVYPKKFPPSRNRNWEGTGGRTGKTRAPKPSPADEKRPPKYEPPSKEK